MSTFIIAEAGVNHNGSLERALEMVREAKRFGADTVKFQTFNADDIAVPDAPKAEYQKASDCMRDQREMLRKLELSEQDHLRLIEECKKEGIEFMSTPFSIKSARLLESLGMKTWKIPSGEITNLPLLEYVGRVARTVILSTGMADTAEVRAALDVLVGAGAEPGRIFLLHCTTAYPTAPADVNLNAMLTLKEFGTGGVGFSDHTLSTVIAPAAVAMGACIVEKHFTLDRSLPGPDHAASLTPDEFAQLTANIRIVETALGSHRKEAVAAEKGNMAVARKSIVAACPIKAGETFTEANLTAKRPGTGISPMLWHSLLGKQARNDYTTDQQISNDELK